MILIFTCPKIDKNEILTEVLIKEKEYINKYVVSGEYYKTILNILDKKEPDIISSVKEYLAKCESGQKHSMTPNINGIIDMFNMLKEEKIRK